MLPCMRYSGGMAKYVPDVKTQRWVIISPSRAARPEEAEKPKVGSPESKGRVCPFCEGNERLTPPEIARIGSGMKNEPGWQVRVVPNKFPITDIHEVIIHGTDCDHDIEQLPMEQSVRILTAYRDRYRANEQYGTVLIFCNHGYHAGASLKHPHAQLVVVPKQISLDALSLEPMKNLVDENTRFVTFCPDFSQWPMETWIVPKHRGKTFGDVVDKEIPDLAGVLTTALRKIERVLKDPNHPFRQANEPFVYNYYIYHGADWFIRIIPRAVHRAGFELGTGLSVNIMDPTEAARLLALTKVE